MAFSTPNLQAFLLLSPTQLASDDDDDGDSDIVDGDDFIDTSDDNNYDTDDDYDDIDIGDDNDGDMMTMTTAANIIKCFASPAALY